MNIGYYVKAREILSLSDTIRKIASSYEEKGKKRE